MPSEASGEVAADHSATVTVPAAEGEGTVDAERVERNVPPTVEAGTKSIGSWADASEEELQQASAPSSAAAPTLVPVKDEVVEEYQIAEALELSRVLATIGNVEEVADDPVATEAPALEPELDLSIFDTTTEPENPAQAVFEELDQLRENSTAELSSSPPELATVETADLLNLGDDPVEASVPAASEPLVADPSGVATEATTADSSDIAPPPTSPNLVAPGVEPIQVGHEPSGPSRPPRTRQRSSRGGQVTRWQEAQREWWKDFERVQQWLYNNSGGRISNGFWPRRISYQDASSEEKWFVSIFESLVQEYSTSNCLALAYYVFDPYTDWAHKYGLDRRRGPSHGKQVIESQDLPPKRIINRTLLGSENPPEEVWDRYYRYLGPQQQPRPKKAAAPAPAGGAAPHLPQPAKAVPAGPKQPDHPPKAKVPQDPKAKAKGWQPSLHTSPPVAPASGPPKVNTSVSPVPQPPKEKAFVFGGVAVPPARDVASTTAEASQPKQPIVVKAKTPNVNLHKLSPPPSFPPPNISTSSSSAGLGPLPSPPYPPPSIPPPPQHPPPTAQELASASPLPKATEVHPEDPNDPPEPVEEGEQCVEEGVEEEVEEEDELVEVEVEEEPESQNSPSAASPRDRNPKRERSDPPIPVRLVARETRERIEIGQEVLRARTELGLETRPNIIQPAVPGWPVTRTDPTGTWLRVAGPSVANASAHTLPYVVPGTPVAPFEEVDPHQLPDSVWRDPSLRGQRTLLATSNLDPTDVVNVAINNPSTDSEGEEPPERARERLNASGRHFIEAAASAPVEAEIVERVPRAPTAPPPKRQRTTVRVTQVHRGVDPKASEPKASETPAVVPKAKAAPEVADSVATTSRSRTRTRARSAEAAPRAPPPTRPERGRASNKIVTPKPHPPKRASTAPVPLRSRQPVAPAPAAPKAEVAPTAKQAKSGLPFKDFPGRKLPYKDPPARPTEQPKVAAPVGPPKEGGRIIPPRPGRPAPVLPPPGSVKPPPPGVHPPGEIRPPSGAKHRSPATSPNPPPLSPDQETAERPLAGEASGSGLAPHRPGRPLPTPSPTSDEPSGNRPKHHGPQLREAPLISPVVEIDSSNIRVCIDWHNTLDQALNAVGELNARIVDRFRAVCRIARNRIEFHIVSYAGESKVEGTTQGANHLIDFLTRNGIPFRELHLARYPCGREGKASIISALQAHCLIDDRGDILNETAQTGAKTIQSEGDLDRELHWVAALEDWIRQESVPGILASRRAVPLRPNQLKDRWGDKREAHRY